MRYTTKTEYGVVALAYMAKKPEGSSLTVKEIAKAEHFSFTYIEKIFQKLRQAAIITSHQGKEGGYILARPPSEITLRQIIEALEGHTFDVFCEPEVREGIICTHLSVCSIRPVWAKTKEVLDGLYDSINLESIANDDVTSEIVSERGESR